VENLHSTKRLRSRRATRVSSLLDMMNNIDRTAHFGSAVPIYEVLTTMGKDGPLLASVVARGAVADAILRILSERQRSTGMALKVELKPHEQIIVGSCVITNTDQRARFLIDGDKIPILREKDIMTPATADTPAKLIYLAVQLMYISPDTQANHGTYFNLLRDIVTAAPSAWPIIEGINTCILSGDLYRALKEARKLIAYEKKLLDVARNKRASETEMRRSA
jgi:flagellar biosynthesis repressor protein FlbT